MAPMPGPTSTGGDVAGRLLDDGYVIVSGMMTAAGVRSAAGHVPVAGRQAAASSA